MTKIEIQTLIKKQRAFFEEEKTFEVKTRIEYLEKLYSTIKKYEDEINFALKEDLGKSQFESYMCEVGMALSEISHLVKNIKRYSSKKRVKTPLAQFPSRSYTLCVPYGTVLIISPWNYPFLLTVDPLAVAVAAGNTVIIKPSAYSPNVSKVIEKIIKEVFCQEHVSVVLGGREENSALLDEKFDFIFFTGSTNVGKVILNKASQHLTPVVLELGGKSPCIVDKTADISLSAKRIVFGKFLNCGQTCVAPDHIYCHKDIKEKFVKEVIEQIKIQYGEFPLKNENYGKIINEKHFSRLLSLIDKEKVVYGGETDHKLLKIAPCVIDNVTEKDKIMEEEIFGPLMPILEFSDFDSLISLIKSKPKALATYLFTKDKKQIEKIDRLSFGGGCINDVIIHIATNNMGFGGVGESGMGSYHGREGFETFSHKKSMVEKKTWLDLPMRYMPYNKKINEKLLKKFLK